MEECIETFHVVTEDGQVLETFSGVCRSPYPYNCAVSGALMWAAERSQPVYITDENGQRLAVCTDNSHTPL